MHRKRGYGSATELDANAYARLESMGHGLDAVVDTNGCRSVPKLAIHCMLFFL